MKPPSVHSLLAKYGIRPRKRLGQHFLVAGPTIDKIVASLHLSGEDTVLEIGPGLGVMTRKIAERAGAVIAVESDERMVEICRTELRDLKNVSIVHNDILEFDLSNMPHDRSKIKVAGNLPYNISSPIIFRLLKNARLISRAVIMLQLEVAQRIAARPGGKDYGILSVMSQAIADVKVLFKVSAQSFTPPPKVLSAVLGMDFTKDMDGQTFERLLRTVRAAFGKRRKTIRNALLGSTELSTPADAIDKAISQAGIDPGSRPEKISVLKYMTLAKLI